MKISRSLLPATALAAVLTGQPNASAATATSSPTPPPVTGADIANLDTPVTGTDKWWAENNTGAGSAKGQIFTTGNVGVLLKAITYQVGSNNKAEPTKTYTVRVGSVSGSTFTEIHSETATQDFFWAGGEYMTWTLDTPVPLDANTTYAIDVGMTRSTSGWQSGIPYINMTADTYLDGERYTSGRNGTGDSVMDIDSGRDRVFHLDLEHPLAPTPEDGASVPAGDVQLGWQNLPSNIGTNVYVDLWFGTDPNNLTQVVDGGMNTTGHTVNAPGAATYYWRLDSFLNGSPDGAPTSSSLFTFVVFDSDADGFPDEYEITHSGSPTGLDRDDDLENGGTGDGLTAWQEYQLGTSPSSPDTDGDGLEDGPETTGAGSRPPTDPTLGDTDGDGLGDKEESNTGTYLNATNTGTDPTDPDTDKDALGDGAELTVGTSPLDPDSDGDLAGDWYELFASDTDPADPASAPSLPYPLPDPDDTPPNPNKPVKVYIMSGQSNMVGFGRLNGSSTGTLNTMARAENKFPDMVDDAGDWTERNDVFYHGVISDTGKGPLAPDVAGSNFGPELGFGYVMGYHHDEPVLLIKTSIGNRSISWDCLPPGSPGFDYDGKTYAGYGQSPNSWDIGAGPTPYVWYAGKQYDDYFLDEADMGPTAWATGLDYPDNCQVRHNDTTYISTAAHTSDNSNQPGTSGLWETYSIYNVTDILDNFASEYPDFADQGFEIAGYVWWQGHKDQGEPHASNYEQNMVNLIKALRAYYENRYPANTVPDAPFVLATIAFGGWDISGAGLTVVEGQLAVSGETGNYPEFAGNVKTVEARSYWRDAGNSPTNQGHHYNQNAETFLLTGDALGRAMADLVTADPRPTFAITAYSYEPATNSLTLTWESDASSTYTVRYSADLVDWSAALASGIPGSEGTTTRTLDLSAIATPGNPLYLRVEKN